MTPRPPTPTENHPLPKWRALAQRLAALSLYRGLLDDPTVRSVQHLLDMLSWPQPDWEGVPGAYAAAHAAVAALPDRGGDPFRGHLIQLVLSDANPFALAAETDGRAVPPGRLEQARRELRTLGALHHLDAEAVRTAALDRSDDGLSEAWVPWSALGEPTTPQDDPSSLRAKLATAEDWGTLAEELADYYRANGVGLFGRYRAFRWDAGRLEGVPDPDPVRLADLVGYDRERAIVLRNTERFVAGLPANNVLLVGERGTGKSSTVKALLNEHAGRGLRLVEVAKEQLGDLAAILRVLRGRPQRFVLFIDDLSFEEHETEYKPLKAVLEGSIEARPANVLLYATSNRRHLVRERFSDRNEQTDDVRRRDTVEEKLSLADRFGLHALFLAPDQQRYLDIVAALARARGLRLPDDDLRARAIRWAEWHNGRSGRTARQFVDDLEGELRLAAGGGTP